MIIVLRKLSVRGFPTKLIYVLDGLVSKQDASARSLMLESAA